MHHEIVKVIIPRVTLKVHAARAAMSF